MTQEAMFDGADLRAEDHSRLKKQLAEVRNLMSDGKWRTLHEIAGGLRYPEASVSARLRDLRKPKFGAWIVERRRVLNCTHYEYRLLARASSSKPRVEIQSLMQAGYQAKLEQELSRLRASKKCAHCKRQLDMFE